jgi:hypothetical protein
MALGNDRLDYAMLDDGAVLLRMADPFFFLLQRYQDELPIYTPAAENLYVPFGMEYPLADLWQAGENQLPHWYFLQPDSRARQLEPVRWLDVYALADFVLDVDCCEQRLQSDANPARFTVPLALEQHQRVETPELWLLTEPDLAAFEELLQVMSDEDIAHFQVARQQTLDGAALLFIREKRRRDAKSGGSGFAFGGQAFASAMGFRNLFLPLSHDLHPPVRRDVYSQLFELRHGVLSIVQQTQGEMHTFRVADPDFGPLAAYVDYVIASEIENLDAILANSPFDLAEYARAPSHQFALPAASPSEAPKPEAIVAKPTAATTESNQPVHRSTTFTVQESGQEWAEEREMELTLINEGQSAPRWRELSDIKGRMGKADECLTALIES